MSRDVLRILKTQVADVSGYPTLPSEFQKHLFFSNP